jgi:hypothetical protein
MNRYSQKSAEMEEHSKPLFDTRDYHGYYQYLETWGQGEDENYCWRFYISGFTSDNQSGYILKWDKTHEIVSFDEHDSVLVNGKRYAHRYWNH